VTPPLAVDDRSLALTYSDDGAGIPTDELVSAFANGFRGHQARASVPAGAGRGLYYCRELMHRMDGSIVALEDRRGAVFRLVLQRADVASA